MTKPVKVRTNVGDRLIVELVPGSQPYLWIGQNDENGVPRYLGSVTVRAVLGAVRRGKTPTAARGRTP